MRGRAGAVARVARRRWFGTATAPPPRPSEDLLRDTASHWQSLVTEDVGAALLRDGFALLPRAFPPRFTRLVRDEMTYLHATGQMYANATHILLHGEQQPTLLEKRHIVETELVLPEIRRQVPALEWFFDSQQVFRAVQRVVPDWLALSDYMIKLQYNEGLGGCFPMHFDSYGDDGKCVTAVLYLNEHWQDGDGGEIVLYPFPQREPVVVQPRDGDLVLFSSQHMLHRVLPATKPRHCLTTWIYSTPDSQHTRAARAAQDTAPVPKEYALHVVDKVMRSSFRRHLAKLHYGDEWARSLYESHRATPAFDKYMATHEREIGVIRGAAAQMLTKFQAKDPAQPSALPGDADALFAFMQQDEQCRALLKELPIAWF